MRHTDEFVIKTREHFAGISKNLIDKVKNGALKVNDPVEYIRWNQIMIDKALSGHYDHTFTYLQYAYYLRTGTNKLANKK